MCQRIILVPDIEYENASPNVTILGMYDVRCTKTEARVWPGNFAIVALAFRMTGDARGAVCARTKDATRRAIERETTPSVSGACL
jgi:hypothetical protein